MPGALSSEVWKPQSAHGYKEGIGFHLATGQCHLIQVISAFQDSKQPPSLVLSMSMLSVLLRADSLYPHQSQNKPRATQRRTGGRHPLTYACPDKQSHSAHSYGGVCAREPRALHSILGRHLPQEGVNVCSTPRASCTSSFSGRKEQHVCCGLKAKWMRLQVRDII